MNQQTNTFPMFFTLEHVENGYILTAKEESEGLTQDPKFRKEVVTSDKIDQRIGHLLCLDTLVKERPVVFHVEAIGEDTYKLDDIPDHENIMTAKLSFAHYTAHKYPADSIIVLNIEETGMIELYGRDAQKVADENDIAISRVGGIPLLRFANNKEGMKAMASYIRNPTVINASEKRIMEWYYSHRVKQESPTLPPCITDSKTNNSPSNTTKK